MLQNSTQYKRWCFVNREAELKKILDDKDIKYKKAYQKVQNSNPQADINSVTIDDENKLINFYIQQFSEICQSAELPLRVEAAAITYYKRFFLRDPINDPDDLLKYFHACLYMAFKHEEIQMDFRMLAKTLSDKYFDKFAELEMTILTKLNFDLKVHSPFFPLEGLFESLRDVPGVYDKKNECANLVRCCHFDHLIFEYPHGMISLAAFLYIMKKHNIDILANEAFNTVVQITEDCKPVLEKLYEKMKANDGRRIPAEDARRPKKKFKLLHQYSTHKDDFVRPPEKHVHANPPIEASK